MRKITLDKGQRLSRKKDFEVLLAKGRSLRFPLFRVTCLKKTDGPTRIAISASKRHFKTAVARNRVKRWVREYFRKRPPGPYVSCDLLINVCAGRGIERHGTFEKQLDEALNKAEVFK